jgi:hypothetical protein
VPLNAAQTPDFVGGTLIGMTPFSSRLLASCAAAKVRRFPCLRTFLNVVDLAVPKNKHFR